MAKNMKFHDVDGLFDPAVEFPWNAEYLYSVVVSREGYGGVDVTITLTPSDNPTGWDTFEPDLKRAIRSAYESLCELEEADWA